MLFRRPQYRRFEYEPRYYHPERDPVEKFRKRLEAQRKIRKKKGRPLLVWGVIFVLAVYAYLALSGLFRS